MLYAVCMLYVVCCVLCVVCCMLTELGLPVEVLQPFLESSVSKVFKQKQQQAATGGHKVFFGTLWLKTGIHVVQNDRTANAHHPKQVLCCFEPSNPFYGRFSVQKMAIFG